MKILKYHADCIANDKLKLINFAWPILSSYIQLHVHAHHLAI